MPLLLASKLSNNELPSNEHVNITLLSLVLGSMLEYAVIVRVLLFSFPFPVIPGVYTRTESTSEKPAAHVAALCLDGLWKRYSYVFQTRDNH